jgi:SAM-dependent methyltransferase
MSNADQSQDDDSALGDLESETDSLTPSKYDYPQKYGRTYPQNSTYKYPNDEREQNHLDIQHHVFLILLDGELFLAPLSSNPQHILDVGTGTGIWAIDAADKYPSASVIGTDLSPIQPEWVPANCEFQVYDMNCTWNFKKKFDLIHCRQLRMTLDEQKLFQQSLKALKPGGWLEIKQTLLFECGDDTLENTSLARWTKEMADALQLNGTPIDKPKDYEQLMMEAGFDNVQVFIDRLPTNRWPKDKKLKELGMWQRESLLEGLGGFSAALLIEKLGWSRLEHDVLLANVSRELQNLKIHAFSRVVTVIGQKPTRSE